MCVCLSVCVCDCASEPIAQVYSEWSEMFIFSSDAQMATKFGREQVANGVTSVQEHLGIKDHTDKRAHMMRCGLHAPLTTHSLTHARTSSLAPLVGQLATDTLTHPITYAVIH